VSGTTCRLRTLPSAILVHVGGFSRESAESLALSGGRALSDGKPNKAPAKAQQLSTSCRELLSSLALVAMVLVLGRYLSAAQIVALSPVLIAAITIRSHRRSSAGRHGDNQATVP
jgi:hypothetical protein